MLIERLVQNWSFKSFFNLDFNTERAEWCGVVFYLDVSNRRSTAVTKFSLKKNKNRSKSNIAYVQVVDDVLFNMKIHVYIS